MELLVIAIILTFASAQESYLEGPENTLSVVGSTATLKCLSPSRNCSGIDWQKYVHGASPVTVFKGPRTILNTYITDRDRYSVDNSTGCDLVIKNAQLTDAGRFICSAIIPMPLSQITRTAYLIIIGTQPKCESIAYEGDIIEGDVMQLKCGVTYNGTHRVSMAWKGVTDALAALNNGTRISLSYSIEAYAPEIPSYTCEASFAFETVFNGAQWLGLATNNVPNVTCATSAIKVIYSVRNVTLTPSLSNYSPGTVITCTASGHPSPTFKWQEIDNCGSWMDIQNQSGSQFTLTDVSSKRYRCVAMNAVRDRSYNTTSREIEFDNTDNLSSTGPIASENCLGIGIGIGLLVAILLAIAVHGILIGLGFLKFQPRTPTKSSDGVVRHQDHEMSHSSHQRSAIPGTGAKLPGEQESAYASLGEDRDANEYASLEKTQKAKPKKKSRL